MTAIEMAEFSVNYPPLKGVGNSPKSKDDDAHNVIAVDLERWPPTRFPLENFPADAFAGQLLMIGKEYVKVVAVDREKGWIFVVGTGINAT